MRPPSLEEAFVHLKKKKKKKKKKNWGSELGAGCTHGTRHEFNSYCIISFSFSFVDYVK